MRSILRGLRRWMLLFRLLIRVEDVSLSRQYFVKGMEGLMGWFGVGLDYTDQASSTIVMAVECNVRPPSFISSI